MSVKRPRTSATYGAAIEQGRQTDGADRSIGNNRARDQHIARVRSLEGVGHGLRQHQVGREPARAGRQIGKTPVDWRARAVRDSRTGCIAGKRGQDWVVAAVRAPRIIGTWQDMVVEIINSSGLETA